MNFNDFNNATPKYIFKSNPDAPYLTLSELIKQNGEKMIYQVRAIYFNTKSRYGAHPVIACEGFNVSLPKHLNEVCHKIADSVEAVEGINAGECGFIIREYTSKNYNKNAFTVDWCNYEK